MELRTEKVPRVIPDITLGFLYLLIPESVFY